MQGKQVTISFQRQSFSCFIIASIPCCYIDAVRGRPLRYFSYLLGCIALVSCLLPFQPLKAHFLLEESTFDTRVQAQTAAKYLNCKGVRKIEDRWKPCDRPLPPSHDQ
jgi:hypothetical protein